MYEHIRNDFLLQLANVFNANELNQIAAALDNVACNYDISPKPTSLVVYRDDIKRIANMFLASKSLEGLSDKTISFYGNRLRIFFDHVEKRPEDVEANDIRLFLYQYQKQASLSDRTLDKFRQILNCFFEWCVNEEYITKNPCKNICGIKYVAEPRHALTRLEFERLRRACKTKRDLAVVDVLYSTGCRVNELVNMKFSDINTDNNSVSIIGKGKKHNTVYLNANAQISLNEYVSKERKGNSDYIFVSERYPYDRISTRGLQRIIKDIGDATGLKVSPHILRHTFATLALQSGMSVDKVQKILGHSSVATTQIYAEVIQSDVETAHKKYVI